MALKLVTNVDLPPHRGPRAFDHAAVHGPSGRLFVAHTANDELDVIDVRTNTHLLSVSGLREVAGVVVAPEEDLVLTANRGEDTVGVLRASAPEEVTKIGVGPRPNGLAFDPGRRLLLVANGGRPGGEGGGGARFSVVDVPGREVRDEIVAPGDPRWAVFDPATDRFYVNIVEPAVIAVINPGRPTGVEKGIEVGIPGPHGIDVDARTGRILCACDGGELVAIEAPSGRVTARAPICGKPDVLFVDPRRRRVYVAIGDPGVVDVFDADSLGKLQCLPTEKGAKTTAIDPGRGRLYVFLPETHRAAVLEDA